MSRKTRKPTPLPTTRGLRRAAKIFEERESRDLFYRAATELVDRAHRGRSRLTLAEALAVLLQTWNVSYYRFHGKFDGRHFEQLEALLAKHAAVLRGLRRRKLGSMSDRVEPTVTELFSEFEAVLGPVGAAKALHLLAPRLFPIWDRTVASAYGVGLGRAGTNAARYWRFMLLTRGQVRAFRAAGYESPRVLKELDQYNYCRFTNEWM
jgi:hypothetical protein